MEIPVFKQEIIKEKWIITVGRLVTQKGPEYLAEVAEYIFVSTMIR